MEGAERQTGYRPPRETDGCTGDVSATHTDPKRSDDEQKLQRASNQEVLDADAQPDSENSFVQATAGDLSQSNVITPAPVEGHPLSLVQLVELRALLVTKSNDSEAIEL